MRIMHYRDMSPTALRHLGFMKNKRLFIAAALKLQFSVGRDAQAERKSCRCAEREDMLRCIRG